MTTNYRDTFITAAPDSSAVRGAAPPKPDSVAGLQYALLCDHPYRFTSDDLLFEVHARRKGIPEADRAREREVFFSKPQACLRASPLVKRYGFGLNHDGNGKVAAYGVETAEYRAFSLRSGIKVTAGLRNGRA